jgi:hypothetical protein
MLYHPNLVAAVNTHSPLAAVAPKAPKSLSKTKAMKPTGPKGEKKPFKK